MMGYAGQQANAGRYGGYGGYQQSGYQQSGYQQAAHQQAAQQQATQDESVGNEAQITVNGCQHATVGPIVRGSFMLSAENHGRPAYKKDQQVNGLDVMIYFWDDRDGANFCGWWFGPKIGGDQVWAYHPSRTTQWPPKTGWKVPYDGPVDPSFVITGKNAKANMGQMQGQMQQVALQQALQQKQAEEMRKRQQMENIRKLEDMRRLQQQQQQQDMRRQQQQQQELRRQQVEENRRKLEEANQKRLEEQKKKQEEQKKKQEEQRAVLTIRRALEKMSHGANPLTFEKLHQELTETLEKELENCGSQKEATQEEIDKGIEKVKAAVEKIKEAQERALALLKELEGLVANAEESHKRLGEEAEVFSTESEMKIDEVVAAEKAVEDAGAEAKEKAKVCMDFIKQHNVEMKAADKVPRTVDAPAAEDEKPTLNKLLQRISGCTRGTEATLTAAKAAKTKAARKAEARKKQDQMKATFDKYDLDKDGMLSRREVLKYAKGEFEFDVPSETTDRIFRVLVEGDTKGVKRELFQRLKVAIGVAREKAKDGQRRAARLEHEKQVAQMKAELEEKVKDITVTVKEAVEAVTKADQQVQPLLGKVSELVSTEMVKLAGQADETLKATKETIISVRKTVAALNEGVSTDLQKWMAIEVKKLQAMMVQCDPKLAKATALLARFRDAAKKKEAEELSTLEKRAVEIIKYNQRLKSRTNEAMFEAADANKDGQIDEAEFLKFFKACEIEPKEEPKEPKEDASKEEAADGAAKNGKEEEPEKKPEKKEMTELAPADLQRLFTYLDEHEEGFVGKDRFMNLIRVFMKVAKDTVISDSISIKESKTLRRLELGEVVEVLEGPAKEATVDVLRVRATVMKDGITGWITLAGNQGTQFLEEGGNLFKVVKETILTESFELDGGGSKESTRKLKDTTRKLKEGEVVEVREWARKEEKSGLMRMKCKAKSDGAIGWVTTVGNQGTVFLEIV